MASVSVASVRSPIVAGNWKMFLDRRGAITLAQGIVSQVTDNNNVQLVLCPPSVYLDAVGNVIGITQAKPFGERVALGAQNMNAAANGAFTGEVAASMLRDVGCRYVIVGHSERRTLMGETDQVVAAKTLAAFAAGLVPIVCVGELLADRESGRTEEVVSAQVIGSLAGVSQANLETIVIAYEPVWAIGTGKVATPEQAQEVHRFIRNLLGKLSSNETAAKVRIQYGGSVKPDNAGSLAAQPDIDGALVGGARLKADDFLLIVKAFQS